MFETLPEELTRAYSMPDVNEPVSLYDGEIELAPQGKAWSAFTSIRNALVHPSPVKKRNLIARRELWSKGRSVVSRRMVFGGDQNVRETPHAPRILDRYGANWILPVSPPFDPMDGRA